MGSDDMLQALERHPIGESYYALLEKYIKSSKLSSIVSDEKLKALRSRVVAVGEGVLSADLLDYAFVDMCWTSNPIAWEILILLLPRMKQENGGKGVGNIVSTISLFPEKVYTSFNSKNILEFFNSKTFVKHISETSATLILSNICSNSINDNSEGIFKFLHKVKITDKKTTRITRMSTWNKLSVINLLALLQNKILTVESPLFIWDIFHSALTSKIKFAIKKDMATFLDVNMFGGKNAALALSGIIDDIVQMYLRKRSVEYSEEHSKEHSTEYSKEHSEGEIIAGCLLSLDVLKFHQNSLHLDSNDLKLKFNPEELKSLLSVLDEKYYYLNRFLEYSIYTNPAINTEKLITI